MSDAQSAPRVLLSPVLLGIITAYQTGCCVDMLALASVAEPIKDTVDARLRLQYGEFVGKKLFASFGRVVTAWYDEVGHSRLTKLFACMPRMRHVVVAHAVYSGNLSVLKQVPVDVVRAVKIPLLDLAALMGHVNVLMYLHTQVGRCGCTTWAMDAAALQGHVDVVAYLLTHRRVGAWMYAVYGAAKNGHFDVVQLFHAHCGYKPHEAFHSALETAASHNHFDIVSYIVDLFGPGVRHSTDVLDDAARDGHLKMVQFLHERNFECTTNAMDGAAGNGHLDVVKWLHDNRTEGCTRDAMDNAAREGHWEIIQWLHVHRREGCTLSSLFNVAYERQWAMVLLLAARCDIGDVEILLLDLQKRAETPLDVVAALKSIVMSER